MRFPIPLPRVTRGFVELSASVRTTGAETAERVASALSTALGEPVRVGGTVLPAGIERAAGTASVPLRLEGVGGAGAIEVDTALLARLLARLSGRTCAVPAALTPTGLEQRLLTVLALLAAEAASGSRAVDALGPRVLLDEEPSRGGRPGPLPSEDLSIALDLWVGDDRGRGRLRLSPEAIRALAAGGTAPTPNACLAVEASWREGTVTLAPEELEALGRGDVLLVDGAGGPTALVLPGGLTVVGRAEGEAFHVEEIRMTEAQAAFPITLTVEIARVTLTLGELARLEPGGALALGVRKDGAVVLRAGEHALARGQLVEVEGALGVRIEQLGAFP